MATRKGWIFNDTLEGTNSADTMDGDLGDDILYGYDGNDDMQGGGGNDELYGGDDNDTLRGGGGNDRLEGGSGNDVITDEEGVDTIVGGSGNDTITAGGNAFRDAVEVEGFDRIDAGSGDDNVTLHGIRIIATGGAGNDTMNVDFGNETVIAGGTGNDTFVVDTYYATVDRHEVAQLFGDGMEVTMTGTSYGVEVFPVGTVIEDSGIDTLDLSNAGTFGGAPFGETYEYSPGLIDLAAGEIRDSLGYDPDSLSQRLLAKIEGFENVIGTFRDDVITGDGEANDLLGHGGEDTIRGGGGADVIRGDLGQTASTHGDDDRLFGESGNDTIEGGLGRDTIEGGTGNDTIRGGAGNDTIAGDGPGASLGFDTLTGGAGADKFVFHGVGKIANLDYGSRGGSQVSVSDTITDFTVSGPEKDLIDLKAVFNLVGGFSSYDLLNSGHIYVQGYGGETRTSPFGTKVMVDLNGGSHTDTSNVYAVADLIGVRAGNLDYTHFIV